MQRRSGSRRSRRASASTSPSSQQFLEYFKGLFVGRDFTYAGDTVHCGAPCLGYSFSTRQSVNTELFTRFPNTVVLALMAAVVFVTVGVTLGILAAIRRGTAADRGIVGVVADLRRHPVLRARAARRALPGGAVEHPPAVHLDIVGGRARTSPGMLAPALILGLVHVDVLHALHPQLDARDALDGLHPHRPLQGHPRAHRARSSTASGPR